MVTVTGDVETGLQQKTVLLVEKKSSTRWMDKVFLAMLLVVLCCGGAMLFVSYWNGRQERQVRVRRPLQAFTQTSALPSLITWGFFFLSQAVPGKTEALTERKNTGDYTRQQQNRSARCLRDADICGLLLRSPLHPEPPQQQSQGSHPLRR